MPFTLQEEREAHVSWTRSDGMIRLLGGGQGRSSLTTSELVSESGSIAGFPLVYKTR